MPDHLKRVQRFAVLCALNFGLTELITYGVHGYLEKSYAVASACVTVAIPLMSYPLSKFWVFRK
jgi:putative flippase GtrA